LAAKFPDLFEANKSRPADDSHDATVQQLTPKLIPIFEQVLGPPEDQLADETRQLLQQVVRVLYQAQPGLFKGHEAVVRLAGVA
jgi:hypothetical protein